MEFKNIVRVQVCYEEGCDLREKEYSIEILNFVGYLNVSDIDERNGVGDIALIQEAVYEWIDEEKLPVGDIVIILELVESGEWEGMFWHKYYLVAKSEIRNITTSST